MARVNGSVGDGAGASWAVCWRGGGSSHGRPAEPTLVRMAKRWWAVAVLTVAATALFIVGAVLPASTGLTVVRTAGDSQTYQGYTPEALRPRMPAIGSALSGLLAFDRGTGRTFPSDICTLVTNGQSLKDTVTTIALDGDCTYVDRLQAIAAATETTGYPKVVLLPLNETVAVGDGLSDIPFPAVFLTAADVAALRLRTGETTVYLPFVPLLDPASFALMALALLTLLLAAAWRSGVVALELQGLAAEDADGEGETQEAPGTAVKMTLAAAFLFIVMGTCMILLLFYFPSIIVYATMALFGLLSFYSGLLVFDALVLLSPLRHVVWLRRVVRTYRIKASKPPIDVGVVKLGVGLVWAGAIVWWGFERNSSYAWVLQDLMGVVLMTAMLQSITLPNLKVASVLLILAFCYDIIFVFGTTIMETVAFGGETGEQVPLLLRFPHLIGEFRGYGGLGYGDVVLPGLLILFARTFDLRRQHRFGPTPSRLGYYACTMLAYCAGLLTTFVALCAMQRAQPALLYLVPWTLGTLAWVGWRRGELRKLWAGEPVTDEDLVEEQGRLGSLLAAHAAAEREDDELNYLDGTGEDDDML